MIANTYDYFHAQGAQAAKAGNFWLSSSPYSGWRGEAWKDGNWSARHQTGKGST